MIKPKFNLLTTAFWDWYIHRLIHSDFHSHTLEGKIETDDAKSVLLLANHFSWWDGFFVYELNKKLMGKRFHVMMLEEQLRKHSMLRGAGAFSIDKSSGRKLLESLAYASQLLETPTNLVVLFPQGRIESAFRQELTFKKGVGRIVRQTTEQLQIVFCINLIDYHSQKKPSVRSYLKTHRGEKDCFSLETAFRSFHSDCVKRQGLICS